MPSADSPSGATEGRSKEAEWADPDPRSSGGGSWQHLWPAPPPRALIHSLYQGKRAEGGRVPSPAGVLWVCSLPPDPPRALAPHQGRLRACGSGSRGSQGPGLFPLQVRLEQGVVGTSPTLGGSGLPVARASVPARTSASPCVGHFGSVGSSAGWEGMGPSLLEPGGPPPPTSPQLKSPPGLCCCCSY